MFRRAPTILPGRPIERTTAIVRVVRPRRIGVHARVCEQGEAGVYEDDRGAPAGLYVAAPLAVAYEWVVAASFRDVLGWHVSRRRDPGPHDADAPVANGSIHASVRVGRDVQMLMIDGPDLRRIHVRLVEMAGDRRAPDSGVAEPGASDT